MFRLNNFAEAPKKNHQEMLKYLENNDKPIKRPFSTETTKNLYKHYMNNRRKELEN